MKSDTCSPFKQTKLPASCGRPATAGKAHICFFLGVILPWNANLKISHERMQNEASFLHIINAVPSSGLHSISSSTYAAERLCHFSRTSVLPKVTNFQRLQLPCQPGRTVRCKDQITKLPRNAGRIGHVYMHGAATRARHNTGQHGGLLGL